MIGLASTLSILLLAAGGLTEAVAKRSSASVISEPSFLGWKPTPCPHGRRCKPDELTKYLSPGAEIILPSNKELFKNLTTRYSEVDKPGIDVVVRVATERDIVQTVHLPGSPAGLELTQTTDELCQKAQQAILGSQHWPWLAYHDPDTARHPH